MPNRTIVSASTSGSTAWTYSGTSLVESVNETSPEWLDYIESPSKPVNESVTLNLSSVTAPNQPGNYTIHFGYGNVDIMSVINLTVDLKYSSNSIVATRTITNAPTGQNQASFNLTAQEITAINSWSGLQLRFNANYTSNSGKGNGIRVYYAYFEVPDYIPIYTSTMSSSSSMTTTAVIHIGLPGSGTSGDPYLISTLSDLDKARRMSSGEYAKLINNIDAFDTINWHSGLGWEPIGTSSSKFAGKLDGNGYVINNLYINRATANVGLFGYVTNGFSVSNLGLENVNITGGNNTGGIVGRLDGTGAIKNSYVKGAVKGTASTSYIGGLAGTVNGVILFDQPYNNILDCYTDCNVSNASSHIAGLVGYLNNSTINTSIAFGTIPVGTTYASPVVGQGFGQYSATTCFYNRELNNMVDYGQAVGKTSEELKDPATYSGWDTTTTWLVSPDKTSYPELMVFEATPEPQPGLFVDGSSSMMTMSNTVLNSSVRFGGHASFSGVSTIDTNYLKIINNDNLNIGSISQIESKGSQTSRGDSAINGISLLNTNSINTRSSSSSINSASDVTLVSSRVFNVSSDINGVNIIYNNSIKTRNSQIDINVNSNVSSISSQIFTLNSNINANVSVMFEGNKVFSADVTLDGVNIVYPKSSVVTSLNSNMDIESDIQARPTIYIGANSDIIGESFFNPTASVLMGSSLFTSGLSNVSANFANIFDSNSYISVSSMLLGSGYLSANSNSKILIISTISGSGEKLGKDLSTKSKFKFSGPTPEFEVILIAVYEQNKDVEFLYFKEGKEYILTQKQVSMLPKNPDGTIHHMFQFIEYVTE